MTESLWQSLRRGIADGDVYVIGAPDDTLTRLLDALDAAEHHLQNCDAQTHGAEDTLAALADAIARLEIGDDA